MKKFATVALSVGLIGAMVAGGSLAYLSDTAGDANVMTLGNVQIDQQEYQRAEDVAHFGELKQGDLVPFEQDQSLMPAVPKADNAYTAEQNNLLKWGTYVTAEGAGNGLWDDTKLSNVVDKMVFVENTGKSNAYYRTIIAFECPEGTDYSQGPDKEFMMNVNSHQLFVWEKVDYAIIDGTRYLIMTATYEEALKPGEISRPSLLQVVMTHNATNDTVEKLGDTYEILVFSQAVQADGFEAQGAATALNEAFGAVTKENHPWVNTAIATNADELVKALEDENDVVLTKNIKIDPASMSNAYGKTGINVKNGQTIDGAGHTLDIKGAGGTWDSGINTTGGLIKDITVTGSFRGIFINHNSTHSEPVVLDNVTIEGVTYTISCDQGENQNLVATNSTFKGWTSYAATLGTATFEDCYFGEGNGYSFMRPYAPTTFIGCDFEAGYKMEPRAAVTFENCTLGGAPLTADNLTTLVTSNIANATVK